MVVRKVPVMGLERSGDVVPTESVVNPANGGGACEQTVKPLGIAKRCWEAYGGCNSQPGRGGDRGERIRDVRRRT